MSPRPSLRYDRTVVYALRRGELVRTSARSAMLRSRRRGALAQEPWRFPMRTVSAQRLADQRSVMRRHPAPLSRLPQPMPGPSPYALRMARAERALARESGGAA